MLTISDNINSNELLIWACECRNSDNIMVILADNNCSDINDMFNDKAWKSARYFKCDYYDSAVNYTYSVIKNSLIKIFYRNIIQNLKCISA